MEFFKAFIYNKLVIQKMTEVFNLDKIRQAKRAYYRTYQAAANVGLRLMPWNWPKPVVKPGALLEVPNILREFGVKKPILVTGPNIVKTIGKRLMEELDKEGFEYVVFSDTEANPSIETVMKIVKKYHAEGADSIVALGGGSPMDAAKAAGAKIVRPKKPLKRMAGIFTVLKKLPPFIAIPTTAGTGSETTIAAIITDKAKNHKYAIMDLNLLPDYAVLDPELLIGLSPRTTGTTGMDALTHAVEAYLCVSYKTKYSNQMAIEATKDIMKYLIPSFDEPLNIFLREKMLLASYKAGIAFTRAGVGNVHALAHTLGGFYNTPHGLANAVILPHVLEDYGEAVYKPLAELADYSGVDIAGSDEMKAKAFVKRIRDMNEYMGIPTGFDMIRSEDIPKMAKQAVSEANPNYPVPVVYFKEDFCRMAERIRIK